MAQKFLTDVSIKDSSNLFVDGKLKVGDLTAATNILHVASGTADTVARFTSGDGLAKIIIEDNDTQAFVGANNNIAYFGPEGGDSAQENIRLDGSAGRGNGGYAAYGSTPNEAYKFRVTAGTLNTSTDANYAALSAKVEGTGTASLSADRYLRGLHIDVDSDATGGDTSNEFRIYGGEFNVKDTGDADLLYGIYALAENEKTSALDNVTTVVGVRAQANIDNTAGTVTNSHGVYGTVRAAGSGAKTTMYGGRFELSNGTSDANITNAYGGFGKIIPSTGYTGTIATARGLYGEVEVSTGNTITNSWGVQAVIDHNGGTATTAAQFRGSSSGTIGTSYGIYSTGAAINRIDGTITLGNITTDSRITFDYGGDHYLEAGTDSLAYKSSGGTSVMSLNASTQAATFAGDVTIGDDLLVPKIRLEDINGTVSSLFKIYAWDDELQFTKRNLSTEAHEGTLLALDYSDDSATFAGDVTVLGGQIYINDTNTKLEEGVGNAFRITTNSGYGEFGPMNSGHCHIQTDRTNFYFNKQIQVDTGIISSYNEDLSLRRAVADAGSVNLNIGMFYSKSINDSQLQLGGFTINTAMEDTYHCYIPGVSPNIFAGAHRRLTVAATKNGTSIAAATLGPAFLAHEETYSTTTSNTDTIIIEISNFQQSYGQWYGITFGSAQWRAKDIDIEISTDNGANYTNIYSENDQPHATVRTPYSGSSTGVNKIRYTLTNWNTTSTRINHIFGYKYLTGDTNYLDKYRDESMYASLNFKDNYAATFGDSGDLVIKHNGNSIIETNASLAAGDLYIKSQGTNHDLYLQAADDILIQPQSGENGIRVHGNDNVELYFNNVRKLRTTNTGINVEGEVVATTLDISGNIQFSDGYLFANSVTSSSTTTTVASVSSSTYTAVFFDYSIKNGTNVRAGTVAATHDGTNVEFNETSTVDLGDTSDVTLSVDLVSSNLSLKATTTSSSWVVKSLVRAI